MVLFLLALTMLFGASILGYILIRYGMLRPDTVSADVPPVPEMGTITVPWTLWISTALILISSFTVHRALDNVRHERQVRFRNGLLITLLLAVGFLLVQAPSLTVLLHEHFQQLKQPGGVQIYGLVFALILVHALHLLGGLIPLSVITFKAHQGRYDHEHHGPIKYITMYWHFLDGVWIAMFAMFLITS